MIPDSQSDYFGRHSLWKHDVIHPPDNHYRNLLAEPEILKTLLQMMSRTPFDSSVCNKSRTRDSSPTIFTPPGYKPFSRSIVS